MSTTRITCAGSPNCSIWMARTSIPLHRRRPLCERLPTDTTTLEPFGDSNRGSSPCCPPRSWPVYRRLPDEHAAELRQIPVVVHRQAAPGIWNLPVQAPISQRTPVSERVTAGRPIQLCLCGGQFLPHVHSKPSPSLRGEPFGSGLRN